MENQSTHLAPMIIKFALIFSVLIYIFVVFQSVGMPASQFDMMAFINNSLYMGLGIAAIGSAVAGKILGEKLKPSPQDHSSAMSDEDKQKVAGRFFTAMIVELALYESIAVYGVIAAFSNKESIYLLPFAIIAIILMIQVPHKPKSE